eukprot:g27575.t1
MGNQPLREPWKRRRLRPSPLLAKVAAGRGLDCVERAERSTSATDVERRQLWLQCLCVESLKEEEPQDRCAVLIGGAGRTYHQDLFQYLLALPLEDENLIFAEACIQKDLDRVFPHCFGQPRVEYCRKKYAVLLAYAQRCPEVGYESGMHFIAGVLVAVMEAEEAFWCLCSIIEKILPAGFFSGAHEHDCSFELDWHAPFEMKLRLLDSIFVQGVDGLHNVALLLLRRERFRFMQCKTFEEAMQLFHVLPIDYGDCDFFDSLVGDLEHRRQSLKMLRGGFDREKPLQTRRSRQVAIDLSQRVSCDPSRLGPTRRGRPRHGMSVLADAARQASTALARLGGRLETDGQQKVDLQGAIDGLEQLAQALEDAGHPDVVPDGPSRSAAHLSGSSLSDALGELVGGWVYGRSPSPPVAEVDEALMMLTPSQRSLVLKPLNVERARNVNGVVMSRVRSAVSVEERVRIFVKVNDLAEGVLDRMSGLTEEQCEAVMESGMKIQRASNPSGVAMSRISEAVRNISDRGSRRIDLNHSGLPRTGASHRNSTGLAVRNVSGAWPEDVVKLMKELGLEDWCGEVLRRLSLPQRQAVVSSQLHALDEHQRQEVLAPGIFVQNVRNTSTAVHSRITNASQVVLWFRYTSVLTSYGHRNDPEAAERCFAEMQNAGVKADVKCYGAMIRTLSWANESLKASAVLREAKALRLADGTMYHQVLAALARAKQHDQVTTLFEEMVSAGIQPGPAALSSCLIELLYIPAFANVTVLPKRGQKENQPCEKAITLRQLLTHTSGIGYGATLDDPWPPEKGAYYKIYEELSERTKSPDMLRRKLDGDLEVWVHFSPDHWAKKRKPETRPMEGTGPASSSVLRPVDPEAFNFTKINEQEVLKDALEVGSWSVSVLACISPLCFGHVLFVPDRAKLRPQALTTELISCGLQLLTASKRSDFRVVFNSMSGFASVNHFHYHGLFLDHAGLIPRELRKRLPVEYMSRSRVAGDRTEGKLCCELLVESWFCRGLILSAGAKEGEPPEGAADLDALTDFAGRVVQFLQEKNLAHNVMFVPYLGERIKPLFDPYEVQEPRAGRACHAVFGLGGKAQDVPPPRAASPEIYIFPRKPEGDCREERTEDPGFNAAICEMSGLLFAHDEQRFNSFDEDRHVGIRGPNMAAVDVM